MKWHIVNVVWGAEYLEAFIEISIPSQLGKGNIPDIPKDVQGVYQLYCDKKSREKFIESSAYQNLSSHIEVKFIDIEIPAHVASHDILNACHKHALKNAYNEDAVVIFLAPDIILSTQVFSYYYKQLKLGKKLIAAPGVRISKEALRRALIARGQGAREETHFEGNPTMSKTDSSGYFGIPPALSLASDQLADMALENLHHLSLSLFWKSKRMSAMCGHLYWWLGKNQLLIRAFHVHPYVVHVQNKVFPENTIDGDFICRAISDKSLWHLIQNTDECAVFEFSKDEQFKNIGMIKPSKWNLRDWVSKYTCNAHHYFASQKFYIGNCQRNANCQSIENESDRVIEDSLEFLRETNWFSVMFQKAFRVWRHYFWRYSRASFLIISGRKKITLKELFRHFFPNKSKDISIVPKKIEKSAT